MNIIFPENLDKNEEAKLERMASDIITLFLAAAGMINESAAKEKDETEAAFNKVVDEIIIEKEELV
ncbi:hypothetical protein DRJ17_04655 [Candidatus Woesearchaeota archaeon]|nr:MAG: hypothetical protein DRJ17_04655 [Candidatus Woesearchaeota archaeon]